MSSTSENLVQNDMASDFTGICLAELWLRDYVGHCFNYASKIQLGACARKLQFKVLAQRDCLPEVQRMLPVELIFRPAPVGRPTGMGRVLRGIQGFVRLSQDLSAIDMHPLNAEWVLFVESASSFQLLAWMWWLRHFRPAAAPAFVVRLLNSYFDEGGRRWKTNATSMRLALRVLETASRKRRVHVAVESEILAEEFRRLTRLPVAVLPMPFTHASSPGGATPLPPDGLLNILSPGRPMLVKGIGTLAQAIKRLADREQMAGLSFTLQDYHALYREPEVADHLAMLRNLGSSAVRIIPQALDEQGYYRMLSEAHVVVLPYDRERYHADSSGPFVEALGLAKPVIVTEGTWMSAQLQKFGAGLTFRDQDPDDLTRAICAARLEYPRLAEQAAARREEWVAYHNPESFVYELLKVAGS